jgi:Tfp pilus assembly protein PilO
MTTKNKPTAPGVSAGLDKRLLLILAVSAAVVVALFLVVLRPATADTAALETARSEAADKVTALQQRLTTIGGEDYFADLAATADAARALTPATSAQTELLTLVPELARQSDLSVSALVGPSAAPSATALSAETYKFEMNGSLAGFDAFVAKLNAQPRLYTVYGLTMTANSTGTYKIAGSVVAWLGSADAPTTSTPTTPTTSTPTTVTGPGGS